MMDNPNFSLNDFKKWICDQQNFRSEIHKAVSNELLGTDVKPKIGLKRMAHTMVPKEGNRKKLALEFAQNGGVISDVDENNYLIEVDTGFFYIKKNYVERC